MSTNRKNVIRKATLSNFTREIIFRTIIVDRESHNRLSASLPLIMDKVNKTIQDVSLYIQDRRIPFISGKLTTYDNPQIHTSRIVLLPTVNNGELVPSARFNYTTLPKQEYRLAGWLYRSAAAPCRR